MTAQPTPIEEAQVMFDTLTAQRALAGAYCAGLLKSMLATKAIPQSHRPLVEMAVARWNATLEMPKGVS